MATLRSGGEQGGRAAAGDGGGGRGAAAGARGPHQDPLHLALPHRRHLLAHEGTNSNSENMLRARSRSRRAARRARRYCALVLVGLHEAHRQGVCCVGRFMHGDACPVCYRLEYSRVRALAVFSLVPPAAIYRRTWVLCCSSVCPCSGVRSVCFGLVGLFAAVVCSPDAIDFDRRCKIHLLLPLTFFVYLVLH